MVSNCDSGRENSSGQWWTVGGYSRQWWLIATAEESMRTVVDSGGNSRQWWPIVTVVESTVVDSG